MGRFDGLNLRELDGAEFELRHPGTGEGMGFFVTVQSYDSEDVDRVARETRQRAMKSKAKASPDELVSGLRVSRAQAAVLSIRDTEDEASTVEGFRQMIAKPGFGWMVEQIENFAGDRASFFPSAETP